MKRLQRDPKIGEYVLHEDGARGPRWADVLTPTQYVRLVAGQVRASGRRIAARFAALDQRLLDAEAERRRRGGG